MPELNVRLLVLERPGYGESDPEARTSVAGWTGHLPLIADALALDRFHLVGYSGGGPFALAGAAVLTERVRRVALAGCPGRD